MEREEPLGTTEKFKLSIREVKGEVDRVKENVKEKFRELGRGLVNHSHAGSINFADPVLIFGTIVCLGFVIGGLFVGGTNGEESVLLGAALETMIVLGKVIFGTKENQNNGR
jgi:hypothetical protein